MSGSAPVLDAAWEAGGAAEAVSGAGRRLRNADRGEPARPRELFAHESRSLVYGATTVRVGYLESRHEYMDG